MAQFLGDLAFVLEVFLLSAGLITYEVAQRDALALTRIAGIVMVVAGGAAIICTSIFWFTYWSAGAFDKAYPVMPMSQ